LPFGPGRSSCLQQNTMFPCPPTGPRSARWGPTSLPLDQPGDNSKEGVPQNPFFGRRGGRVQGGGPIGRAPSLAFLSHRFLWKESGAPGGPTALIKRNTYHRHKHSRNKNRSRRAEASRPTEYHAHAVVLKFGVSPRTMDRPGGRSPHSVGG